MSCLSIKLPPAKRAWKSFISKLLKLNKSKAIGKKKARLFITPTHVNATSQSFFLDQRSQPYKHIIKRTRDALLFRSKKAYIFKRKKKKKKKKNTPVYLDNLFKEPAAVTELVEHVHIPITKYQAREVKKTASNIHSRVEMARTSKGKEKAVEKVCAADEMWESMGFASPQMHGIDERAEEFIARVRAEMQFQEMMARRL